jgi:hypothetical protein
MKKQRREKEEKRNKGNKNREGGMEIHKPREKARK